MCKGMFEVVVCSDPGSTLQPLHVVLPPWWMPGKRAISKNAMADLTLAELCTEAVWVGATRCCCLKHMMMGLNDR